LHRPSLSPETPNAFRPRWAGLWRTLRAEHRLLVALTAWAVALTWAYAPALRDMAERWSQDPRYSHGYLVPVFALLVLWVRRDRLDRAALRPSWAGLALLAAGVLLHLAGGYLFYRWLDALSLLPTVAGACLLCGGPAALRWCWPAVAFLTFMMPLPYQAEVALAHPLQRLATDASAYAMQTLGLPAVAEGNVIFVEELPIGVGEACSGLGMLVTFFALSTAVTLVIRRPLRDRVVIFLSAAPIAVLMNVVRVTVTGVLFVLAGSHVARVAFHDLAGWLMMPAALGLLWLELVFLEHLFLPPVRTGPVPVAREAPTARTPRKLPASNRPVAVPARVPAPDQTPNPKQASCPTGAEPAASPWRPLS
jgi:exosortase